ncbi:MAG: hypothetical protein JXP34_10765 [Planctomycetes bacterium]|nr:hypothetical protein [Planctomycetota bacterium]
MTRIRFLGRPAAFAALGAIVLLCGCAEFRAERPAAQDPPDIGRRALAMVALREVEGADRTEIVRGLRDLGFVYVYETPDDAGGACILVDVRAQNETAVYSNLFDDTRSAGYWIGFPFLLPFEIVYFPIDRYSVTRTYDVRIEKPGSAPRDVRFRAQEFGSNYYNPVQAVRRGLDGRLEGLLIERLAQEISAAL